MYVVELFFFWESKIDLIDKKKKLCYLLGVVFLFFCVGIRSGLNVRFKFLFVLF